MMLASSTLTVGLVVCMSLTVFAVAGERHFRRPKRESSINSQQAKARTNDDSKKHYESTLHNDPNAGFHNILPNYRTPGRAYMDHFVL